jgi:hypothetical protein
MGDKDSTLEPGTTGPERIEIGSAEAMRGWATRFDVSPDQIREAVERVGDLASDVELHLKGSRSSTNDDRVEASE